MSNRKNVLVILCDQLRKDFLSCYGGKAVATPNIDRLVRDGVLFENATTVSPVCAPARASMMTGRYVSDHNVWTNDVVFREGMDYLPQRMTEMGYSAGAFGKLHHYPGKDLKGFDVGFQMEENRLQDEDDYFKYLKELHPEITDLYGKNQQVGGDFAFPHEHYYEYWIASNTMDFIDASVEKERPFFAWTSFQGPHGPLDPPVDFTYSIDAENIPEPNSMDFDSTCDVALYRKYCNNHGINKESMAEYRMKYLKLIEFIDVQIGRIIAHLEEKGLYEKTVIMFSADHGDMCGDFGMIQKGPYPYAPQFEVPFILTNCEEAQKGTTSDMLVSNFDIGATALAIAGDKKVFGTARNIIEMLVDKSKEREYSFSEFCDSAKFIDTKRYRFVYYPFSKQCELFDKTLANYELTNLANDENYASLKAEFLMHVIDYMIVAKGVCIEAQDLVPSVQSGLAKILPSYQDSIQLVFPIAHETSRESLRKRGLDADYNEFCKEKNVTRCYAVYWDSQLKQKHKD